MSWRKALVVVTLITAVLKLVLYLSVTYLTLRVKLAFVRRSNVRKLKKELLKSGMSKELIEYLVSEYSNTLKSIQVEYLNFSKWVRSKRK